MVYAIFSVQLFLFLFFVLKSIIALNIIFYLLIFAFVGLTAIALFRLKPSNIFILLLSFILNVFIANFFWWLNMLPFISLYFVIKETLKEQGVNFANQSIVLLPVVFLGLVPIHLIGLFGPYLKNLLLSALFAKPKGNPITSLPSEGSGGAPIVSFTRNVYIISKKLLWDSPKLIAVVSNMFLILYFVVIYFIVREFILIGRSKSKVDSKVNYFKFILIGLIGVLVFSINESYRSFLIIFNKIGFSQSSQGPSRAVLYGSISIFIIALLIFITLAKKRAKGDYPYRAKNQEAVTISFIALTVIVFFIFLILRAYEVFGEGPFNNVLNVILFASMFFTVVFLALGILSFIKKSRGKNLTKIFGDKTTTFFEELIVSKGISESLKEMTNSTNYALFLYFSVLRLLANKGSEIERFETPNEFLKRVKTKIDVPHFQFLTNVFNKIKYSLGKISEEEFELLKSYSDEMISYLEDYKEKL
jgi:preprotein translocase subunit SecG